MDNGGKSHFETKSLILRTKPDFGSLKVEDTKGLVHPSALK
jgi:hypothetical protein